MSALPCSFLIAMLFAAAVVASSSSSSVAAGVKVTARPPDDEQEKLSIYLVSVHGEPFVVTAAGVGRRNATWYRSQKRRAARLHDGLLQRAMDMDDMDDGGGCGGPGAGGSGSSHRCRRIYSFHHSVNGFAVHATASLAERLRSAPEVAAVEEDVGTRLMTTYTPRLLGLPDGVWRRHRPHRGAGKGDDDEVEDDDGEGEGVVVGVVDSGVDPAHASFAYVPRPSPAAADPPDDDGGGRRRCSVGPMFPRGSCNGKIVTARYFAAGAAAAALPLDPSRDLSPFDAEGHGSHVASIAVGNCGVPVVVGGAMYGIASGMAPGARLAVYKAVYPAGGTMADLIAAIDQAIEDEVDVLVLSIGPDERPATASKVTFLSMLDVALLYARRAGVFVAQAAGNRGPAESSVVSYSPWVTTVAAATTGRSYTSSLLLGDGRRIPGLGLSAPTTGQSRLVAAKDAAPPDAASMERAEECQDASALRWRADALRGSIVVCSFSRGFYNGTSTVTAILGVAEALGFAGFVLAADVGGDFLAQPLPLAAVPGVMVPRVADALALWSYYAAHTVYAGGATVFGATAEVTEGRVAAFTDAAAPVVARYSSRGPDVVADGASSSSSSSTWTPADVLKPDILAPGDQIWAAWSAVSVNEPILAGDRFAMVSGTSMAAPHIAGVAALIRQRHPSWAPAAVASALSTTALRHDGKNRPIMSEGFEIGSLLPATPFDSGAGFVNTAGAMDPGLVVAPEPDDFTGFLCSLPQLTPDDVRAATGLPCDAPTSLVSSSPADLNLPSVTVAALRGSMSVRRRVTNVAGDAETYLCSALPPAGVDVAVRPGWFEVAPGETQEVVIELRVTVASDAFGFGEVLLAGSLDHLVRLPLAVRPLAVAA